MTAGSRRTFRPGIKFHTAIRNLIHDYPCDTGIFKELIQNADDGGAREILFLIDHRDHGAGVDKPNDWDRLCGPALIAANDQPFTDEDLENIQHVGDSDKIERAARTGKFGRGFNSVYNLTDNPLLLTKGGLYLFDPCQWVVRDGGNGDAWEQTDDLVQPVIKSLSDPRLELKKYLNHGALFRLPLRRSLLGSSSKDRVSEQVWKPDQLAGLVDGLLDLAPSILVFLRNLETIRVCEMHDGMDVPRIRFTVETANPDEVRAARDLQLEIEGDGVEAALDRICAIEEQSLVCHTHDVRIRTEAGECSYRWLIGSGFCRGEEGALVKAARELYEAGEKALPHSAVGVLLERNEEEFPAGKSGLFCGLPLDPTPLGGAFTVLLQGCFDLDGSRRGVTGPSGGEDGTKALRSRWNRLLIEQALARTYAEVLEQVLRLKTNLNPEWFYSLMPGSADIATPFDGLSVGVWRLLATKRVLHSAQGSWLEANKIRLAFINNGEALREFLIAEGFAVTDPPLPGHIRKGLESVKALPSAISAAEVAAHLKTDKDPDCAIECAPNPGLRKKEGVYAVVSFLRDSKDNRGLEGLPLAICRDGKMHLFQGGAGRKVIADTVVCEIFAGFEEWFLDPEFVEKVAIEPIEGDSSVVKADSSFVLDNLKCITGVTEDSSIVWEPNAANPPNSQWLAKVLGYLNGLPEAQRPAGGIIDGVHLIPGDDGKLYKPGTSETPLLLQLPEQKMSVVLRKIGLRHHFLAPKDILTKSLTSFRDTYDRVWGLTGRDLSDSLADAIGKLDESQKAALADPATIEPLLRCLADKIDDIDDDRCKKLIALPIFSDLNGEYSTLDETCYLPGDLSPPAVAIDIRVMDPGDWRPILEKLGLKPITLVAWLRDHALPAYPDLPPEDRLKLLVWIRDEWNHLVTAWIGESKGLRDTLREIKLIPLDDGSLASPAKVYHPVARKLIESVLGRQVDYPAQTPFDIEKDLWHRFFHDLGLQTSPGAKDIARCIDVIVKRATECNTLDKDDETTLLQIFNHLQNSEPGLLDVEWETSSGWYSLLRFLKETEWLPPARASDLDRFLVWQEPQRSLYKPTELFPFPQGYLVASRKPLLSPRLKLGKEFRAKLDLPWTPALADVVVHAKVVFAKVEEMLGKQTSDKPFQTPLQQIYSHLATVQDEAEVAEIREQLATIPCIFLPDEKRMVLPADVYRISHSRFFPLKFQLRIQNESVDRGLEVLGRTEGPAVENLVDAIQRLGRTYPCALDEPMLRAVIHAIEWIARENEGQPPEVFLPNAEKVLCRPQILIFDDFPTLTEELEDIGERLVHSDISLRVATRWPVQRLSNAQAEWLKGESGHVPAEFVSICKIIESRLRDPLFAMALDRLARQVNTSLPSRELDWVGHVEIRPLAELRCRYTLEVNGQTLELGEAGGAVSYDPEVGQGGAFLVSATFQESMLDNLAEELARQMRDIAQPDVMVLRGILDPTLPLDRLDRFLDQKYVPRVAQWTDANDEDSKTGDTNGSDYYSNEQTEEEDELRSKTETDGARNESAPEGKREDTTSTGPHPTVKGSDEPNVTGTEKPASSSSTRPTPNGADEGANKRKPTGATSTDPRPETNQENSRPLGSRLPRTTSPPKDGSKPQHPLRRTQDDLWISRPLAKRHEHEELEMEDPANDERRENLAIGKAAVGWVLQYEHSQGRKPKSMPHANPGYDVESRQGRLVERYIEVKGIDGEWGRNGVPLSSIQFFRQLHPTDPVEGDGTPMGDKFWLYVVEHARDPEKVRIHMIQNPATKANQFRFDCGWREAGTEAGDFVPLLPARGITLRAFLDEGGHEDGLITEVAETNLIVQFGTGAATAIAYDPTRHLLIK